MTVNELSPKFEGHVNIRKSRDLLMR